MKVIITGGVTGLPYRIAALPEDVVDLDDKVAMELIEQNLAQPVKKGKAVETATDPKATKAENAMKNPTKKTATKTKK